jgi:uncharacterized protein (TIGR03067 family)
MRAVASLLALSLTAAMAAADDDPEPPPADHQALQGTWQVTSYKSLSQPPKSPTKITITFAKDKLTVKNVDGDKPRESSYKLDPKKSPKQIDITYNGRTARGIYKIEKGTLYLSTSSDPKMARPKNFTEDGPLNLVLKKAKK